MAISSGTSAASRRARKPQSFGGAPVNSTTPAGQQLEQPQQTPQQPRTASLATTPTQLNVGNQPQGASQFIAPKMAPAPAASDVWHNPYQTNYAAVPVAPPPTPNPYLTGEDIGNRIAEYADWDKYLGNIDLQASNMAVDTTTKVADIERAVAANLEGANWNMAARGLGASSIKDSQKADISAQGANQKGGMIGQLANTENFAAGERAKFGTQIQPGIEAKYASIGGQHKADADYAAAIAAAQNQPAPPANSTAAVGAVHSGVTPTVTGSTSQPTTGGGVFYQDTGPRAGLRYIVYNGARRYESRPGAGDWGTGGVIVAA
jgi:hypothetical protein